MIYICIYSGLSKSFLIKALIYLSSLSSVLLGIKISGALLSNNISLSLIIFSKIYNCVERNITSINI